MYFGNEKYYEIKCFKMYKVIVFFLKIVFNL